MKRIFLVLMILSGMYASAQVPSNYLNIRSRYNLIAGKFDSTLHIPKGVTPGLYTGGSTQSGALFYNTSDSSLYVYTGYQWRKLGEGGSTDSTIFATVYRTDTLAQNIRDEIAALPAPTTPTLQEVFATESNNALMAGNFKVDVNGHDIDFDDAVNGFITVSSYFSMVGGDSLNMQSSDANRILLKNDTIFIKPVLGNLNIDSLNSGSSADSVLVWDKETGSVKYRNAADFGGIGGVGITRIAPTDSTTGDSYGAQIIGGNSLQLNTFSTENYGVVPPSTGTTTDFLRADGTWASPAGSGSHVDTIYRKAGQDSIFFKINGGAERAIKDSTGGSGSLDKGTTTISSSATTRVLYDSSGVLSNNANFTFNQSTNLLQVGGTTGRIRSGNFDINVPDANGTYLNATTASLFFISGGSNYGAAINGRRMYVGGSTTPHSTLQSGGSFAKAYVAKSSSYTATATDCVIELTATGQTITLPTAVGCAGREYTIKLTASGTGTVGTTSSQTIDGSTTYSLSAQYKYVTVTSNGANWMITANN